MGFVDYLRGLLGWWSSSGVDPTGGLVCGKFTVRPVVSGAFAVRSVTSSAFTVRPVVSGAFAMREC